MFGVFLTPPFCCHFHYSFPFHPLHPTENNSMDLWPAKGYLSQEGGGTSRVNNTPAFSCSDRFRSRARSFYDSYFQSYHVRVLLWMPLCEEGRGEVPAPSRWGCRKGRALRGCVQLMFNHLPGQDVLQLPGTHCLPPGRVCAAGAGKREPRSLLPFLGGSRQSFLGDP